MAVNDAPVADVVFVIEGTAALSPYVESLKNQYILPTLEQFSGGPPDDRDYGQDNNLNCSLYALVVYFGHDSAPSRMRTCYAPATRSSKFLQWLEKVQFVSGGGETGCSLAEGLATAIQVFEDYATLRENSGCTMKEEPQKHCILICNTPPYMTPVVESPNYFGMTLDRLAAEIQKKNINLSIITPRKMKFLYKLFADCGGDLKSALLKKYAKDTRHCVLLRGFALQERPMSPQTHHPPQNHTPQPEMKPPTPTPAAQNLPERPPTGPPPPKQRKVTSPAPALFQSTPAPPPPTPPQPAPTRPPINMQPTRGPTPNNFMPGERVSPVARPGWAPSPNAPTGPHMPPSPQNPMVSMPQGARMQSVLQTTLTNIQQPVSVSQARPTMQGQPMATMIPRAPNMNMMRANMNQLVRGQMPNPGVGNSPMGNFPGSMNLPNQVTGPPNSSIGPPKPSQSPNQNPALPPQGGPGSNQLQGPHPPNPMMHPNMGPISQESNHPNSVPMSMSQAQSHLPPGSMGPLGPNKPGQLNPNLQLGPPNVQGPNHPQGQMGQSQMMHNISRSQDVNQPNQININQAPSHMPGGMGSMGQLKPGQSLNQNLQLGPGGLGPNQSQGPMGGSQMGHPNMPPMSQETGTSGQMTIPISQAGPQMTMQPGGIGTMGNRPMGPGVQGVNPLANLVNMVPGTQTTPLMARDRKPIWTGVIEYKEKQPIGQGPMNQMNKASHSLEATISCTVINGKPEVNAEKWPDRLELQLLPRQLISKLFIILKNSAYHVGIHFSQIDNDGVQKLSKFMSGQWVGCIQFQLTTGPPVQTRIMVVVYMPDKKLYMGFIPHDQEQFFSSMKNIIESYKKQNMVPPGGMPSNIPQNPAAMQKMQGPGAGQGAAPGAGSGQPFSSAPGNMTPQEAERQRNLREIAQLRASLEAAQQKELQYQRGGPGQPHYPPGQGPPGQNMGQENPSGPMQQPMPQQTIRAQLFSHLQQNNRFQLNQATTQAPTGVTANPQLRHLLQQQGQIRGATNVGAMGSSQQIPHMQMATTMGNQQQGGPNFNNSQQMQPVQNQGQNWPGGGMNF